MYVSMLRFSAQARKKVRAIYLRLILAICPFASGVLTLEALEVMGLW